MSNALRTGQNAKTLISLLDPTLRKAIWVRSIEHDLRKQGAGGQGLNAQL